MKVILGGSRYSLRNDHPFAQAILALAQQYQRDPAVRNASTSNASTPQRNDIKRLWGALRTPHRRLLKEVARHPNGLSQGELEVLLGTDWSGLRGVHNGLARIAENAGDEKPIRVVGYRSDNRRYLMDPDVALTINTLAAKSRVP